MSQSLRILVADDLDANLKLISKHLERRGYSVVAVSDGRQALAAYEQQVFDAILLDVMMPEMDGLDAAKNIRAIENRNWIPIIFLSALSKEEDVIKGLEAGGDDYLTKPIDLTLLDAKIMVMQRIAEMQRELADKSARLEQYQCETEAENAMASELMARIILVPEMDENTLRHWVLPAAHFSGDMVAAVKGRNNRLYILHADSTGHGLTAALPLMPVSQTFYAMAEKGFSLSTIVTQINACVRRYIPTERFVAAVLISIDFNNKLIEVWNGGCPDMLYVDDHGNVLQNFKSRHLAFGVLGHEQFDSNTQVMQWQTPGQLVMYSDGMIEARNDNGEMFGEERLLEALEANAGSRMFNGLIDTLTLHIGKDITQDDISLVMARCE
jgi:CheY-like chemotaxis protein